MSFAPVLPASPAGVTRVVPVEAVYGCCKPASAAECNRPTGGEATWTHGHLPEQVRLCRWLERGGQGAECAGRAEQGGDRAGKRADHAWEGVGSTAVAYAESRAPF